MEWQTYEDGYEPVDNEMYIVTLDDGESRYVDFIEFYRGEWCTEYKVVAWLQIEPYED